ncbi:MAG TPA: helix-turn-helix domain-containing protein [Solirubrobacteraceae bacterium]|nr:helix-turn-helix domain-containing protein [Solirubrobacteraceae bacterium]
MSVTVVGYDPSMGRWQPGARGRLLQAALELYGEHGYERTTVAEIAARAGLTERTFFRHFADKREVLFAGNDILNGVIVEAVAATPAETAPIDVAAAGMRAAAAMIQEGGDLPRRRAAIIAPSVELQERELIKLASMTALLAEQLRGRGIAEPAASLAAEAAVAAFKTGFARWLEDEPGRDLRQRIDESLDELRAVAAGS